MAGLRLEFVLTETFKTSFQLLPPEIKKKVRKQLRLLQHNPKHRSLRIHRLNDEWEFYIDIHYRCFFLLERERDYFACARYPFDSG